MQVTLKLIKTDVFLHLTCEYMHSDERVNQTSMDKILLSACPLLKPCFPKFIQEQMRCSEMSSNTRTKAKQHREHYEHNKPAL